ncbi:MAG: WD40/YVTN/BNR-like repeat-containing protein [Pyrinomonadaceae bacterium]
MKDKISRVAFDEKKLRGLSCLAGGTILHTVDGGATWTQQRSNTTATLYHVDFRNNRVGWAVGERGTVLRTTDGGDTWFPVTLPVRATLLGVQFTSDDDGWIVGRGRHNPAHGRRRAHMDKTGKHDDAESLRALYRQEK